MALSKPSKRLDAAGFMLVEVLVALFIIALLMGALIKSTTDNARDTIILKNKTIASWVAENIAANIQVGLIPTPSPGASGLQSVKIPMLGQTWYGTANFLSVAQNAWRIDISVEPTDFKTQSVIHLITYFSKDFKVESTP